MPLDDRPTSSIREMTESDRRRHLSEQVRLAELGWIEAEHTASCLEEGKTILRNSMCNELLEKRLATSGASAERQAMVSDTYKQYLRRMHDARRLANIAKADWKAVERSYWAAVSSEASERAQMRMSGTA